jgi:hypothetical protein
MTFDTKEGETGSGEEHFSILDLHVTMGLATMDPDQETVGFRTPKMTK